MSGQKLENQAERSIKYLLRNLRLSLARLSFLKTYIHQQPFALQDQAKVIPVHIF
jgi:hypothetical protein